MSTPDPAPFDPHAFPSDLVAAQQEVARLSAELHALPARLPWSREPHPGRPASPGWSEKEGAAFDRLRGELRTAAATVQGHHWWARCREQGVDGPAMVAARRR
ncbi:hypothetical protein ABZ467_37680 [Streptomyces sp. NPDC005727]|uniref:hypothetical protein n=1 Tax=Streptomyces sp. NPDC005727 TaxID=3157053 RepID=UPI00340F733A